MKYFDDQHPQGVTITPAEMGEKFRVALSTRAAEGDPLAPLKSFLFYNAMPIIAHLKEQSA